MANDLTGLDDAVASVTGARQQQAAAGVRNNMQFAPAANPDQEAQHRQLARFLDQPLTTVSADPETAQLQAALKSTDADRLAADTPQTATLLGDPSNARMLHDTIPNVAATEQAVQQLAAQPQRSVWSDMWSAMGSTFNKIEAFNARYSLAGHNNPAAQAYAARLDAEARAQAPQTLPGQIVAGLSYAPYMGAAPFIVGAAEGNAREQDLLSQGADPDAARLSAVSEGGLQALIQMVPFGKVVFKAGTKPLVGSVLSSGAKAAVGGAAQSTVGDYATQQILQGAGENKLADQYAPTLDKALQSAAFMGALHVGVQSIHGAASDRPPVVPDIAQAGQTMGFLQKLGELATTGKFRERDPAAFNQFVTDVSEQTGAPDVYVDARKLAEALDQGNVSGAELAAKLPDVAAQMREALQSEGTVKIPLADYATHIAGGPLDASLLPHLKTDPAGMSYDEAKQFQQSQVDALTPEAKTLAATNDTAPADTHAAELQGVHDSILNELQATGRYTPDVSAAYAALARDFYGTMAGRTGQSPAELFAAHPLHVAAADVAGEHLDQPPRVSTFTDKNGDAHEITVKPETFGFNAKTPNSVVVKVPGVGFIDFDVRPDGVLTAANTQVSPEFRGRGIAEAMYRAARDAGYDIAPGQVQTDKGLKMVESLQAKGVINKEAIGQRFRAGDMELAQEIHPPIEKFEDLRLRRASADIKATAASAFGDSPGDFTILPGVRQIPFSDFKLQGVESGLFDTPEQRTRISDLAAKIRKNGSIEPLFIAQREDGVRYLAEGQHRARALAELGYDSVPARVIVQHGDSPNYFVRQDARGTYSPSTNTITALHGADLSTFLHELGHHFLETFSRIAADPRAPKDIANDFAALMAQHGSAETAKEWLAKSLDDRRDVHETFARGFEAYLMEGKAPTPELQSLFGRFRSWLIQVYKSLSALRVQLTPEVRGVMDRMLASDAEIRQAEKVRAMEALFKAKPEGMSDADYEAYQGLGQQATEDAVSNLQARSLRDMQWLSNAKSRAMRELQRTADTERKAIREEATREYDENPATQAKEALAAAEKEHEQHPTSADFNAQLIAEQYGFDTVDQMHRAIDELGDRKTYIEGVTDQRMLERHGELVDPRSIERAAEAAVHNEARTRFLATELMTLAKATGSPRLLAKAAKEAADAAIAAKRVRDLRPDQYSAAEARAGRAADKAFKAGDITQAAVQKRAQLLSNALARSAVDAATEITKAVEYLKKFDKDSIREKIDVDYRDQIDALLAAHDLRTSVSNKALDKRVSLKEFVEHEQAAGREPMVPQELVDDANLTHYKDMTVESFRGLVDAVRSLDHLGRLKTKILDGRDARDFKAVVDEAVAAMGELPQRTPETNRGLSAVDKKWLGVKSTIRSADASLIKMEQVIDWLDGHNAQGVLNRVVFRRIADAGTRENDLRTDIVGRLRELAKAQPKGYGSDFDNKLELPGLIDTKTGKTQILLKRELLSAALNRGNESNWQKLLTGEKGWNEASLLSAFDQYLTKADWDYVQGVWHAINSLWPEIDAMERRLGNTSPEKIAPRAFDTPHGTYEGGYYPAVYDPLRSFDVEQNRQRSAESLFENNYQKATTSKGHTIERNENYARPFLLSLDVIPRHVTQVIHDIAYREAVMDADRFLADKRVREAIEGVMGREYYQQFRPWLQALANDKVYDARGLAFWDQAAHWARTTTTMVGLGYRLSTMMIHGATAASNSVGEIGARWMASGVRDVMGTPSKMAAARDFIFERSGEMRHRMNEVDRDVRDQLREMEASAATGVTSAARDVLNGAKRGAFYGIAMLDFASAMPTWMGAYNRGLHEGLTEQQAVYAADKAVRNAHGGTGVKDLAAIQRGSEFQKLFTMFYSFWNHFYNRQRDIGRTVTQIPGKVAEGDYAGARRDFAMVLARSWFYFVVPQLLHAALKPPAAGTQDEDNGWAHWAAEEIGLGLFSGVPVVRDLASAASTGRDYNPTPAVSIVKAAAATGKDIAGAANGQGPSDRWVQHAIQTAGYVFGLPTGQASNAAQFLWDVSDGKVNPQDLADWWTGLKNGHL